MRARIVGMRINRTPGNLGVPGNEAPPTETASLDFEAIPEAGAPPIPGSTSITVSDWSAYSLGQVCDLIPKPVPD